MNRVRIGIIGLGGWGECHLQAYRALPQAEVVAVCDNREHRLSELADRYGIESGSLYQDYRELLARDDLDLVSVVTYEKDHLEPTLLALASGKHVLVEKPVSIRQDEAVRMQEAAEANGRYVLPGHLLRFDPRYRSIAGAIRDDQIGRPVSMYFKRSRQRSLFEIYCRTHTVYELMVHDLDLALWYAADRVKSVQAFSRSVSGASAPEVLWAVLEFAGGTLAVLQSDWMTPDEAGIAIADSVEVTGEKGNARFGGADGGLQIWNGSGRYNPDHFIHHSAEGIVYGALREQLAYVCGCIQQGTRPETISFADAVHVIEVADAIMKSCETGRQIRLS